MSYSENPYQSNPYQSTWGNLAVNAAADERADFIRKTYLHLGGAVLAFIAIEAALFQTALPGVIFDMLLGTRMSWMIVVLAFVGVSYVASSWAQSATSVAMQYAGLALYVVTEAIIFVPILYIADRHFPGVIPQAGVITGVMFAGLTAIVFLTGHDFSYLRPILMICSLTAVLLVLWAMFFSHQSLGIPFSVLMIAMACGYILYDTSNVMKHYRIGQHVAASLALFASVALLFYYVLRILMQLNRR